MASRDNSSGRRPASKGNFQKKGRKKDKNYRIDPRNIKNFKKESSGEPKKSSPSDGIRLNKFIANAGVCSRREADVFIAAGNVTVNGKPVTEMGYKVLPSDTVRFDDQPLSVEEKRYVLLNKPKNYLTSLEDERGRKTVMELVAGVTKERIYPVGRLDRNTTGLLLFTNDGDMVKKLTDPKRNVKQLFHVSLDKKLALKDLQSLSENIVVDGKMVFVESVSYIEGQPKSEIGIEIHSGRNRIISKIFDKLGYSVTKLDRVIFAGLTKKNLPRGRQRALTQQEINNLHMI